MPAQFALAYYLGSAIFGSALFAFITFLDVNIPNGTFDLAGFGMAFLISCAIAMIGSLSFHGWSVRSIYCCCTRYTWLILSSKRDQTEAVPADY